MEENEYEIETPVVDSDSDTSKMPLVVVGLALVGGATVAKKAFNKVRGYRIVRKDSTPEPAPQPATPAEA